MAENIKMVALDLDGTLLDSKKHISDYTKEVLAKTVDLGVSVVISTGRPISGLTEEIRNLKGVRYALTVNGARIYDLITGEVIYEEPVPFDQASEIFDILQNFDAMEEIYYEGKGYAEEEKLSKVEDYMPNPPMAEYLRSTRYKISGLREFFDQKKLPVDKIQGLFKYQDEKAQAIEMIRSNELLAGVEISGDSKENLEVNAKGVNKGKGLLKLGEILGITSEEIMACGDANNDFKMMQEVGLAVAMKNASEDILNISDYVTASNDEDGVAKAIKKFVLDRRISC